MILTSSFKWNFEPRCTVMSLEIKSRNGILLVMNNAVKVVGWNDIISSLGKSLDLSTSPLESFPRETLL